MSSAAMLLDPPPVAVASGVAPAAVPPGPVGLSADEVSALVAAAAAIDDTTSDRFTLEDAASCVRRLKSWVESRELMVARRLAQVAAFPEAALAGATNSDVRSASKVLSRVKTADVAPEFEVALASGDISAQHVDAMTAGLARLPIGVRHRLGALAPHLVERAAAESAFDFAKRVDAEVRRIERAQGDTAADRLRRQRRAMRARTWIDQSSGMWKLHASLDPFTGARLSGRLEATMRELFHDTHPPGAPDDPIERQNFLRAHALLDLLDLDVDDHSDVPPVVTTPRDGGAGGHVAGAGAPDRDKQAAGPGSTTQRGRVRSRWRREAVIVVDLAGSELAAPPGTDSLVAASPGAAATPSHTDSRSRSVAESGHERGPALERGRESEIEPQRESKREPGRESTIVIDVGYPIELPASSVDMLLADPQTRSRVVVVDRGRVVSAPGRMNLGRSERAATSEQRLALSALYATCAIPGCATGYWQSKLHHIHWWRHGGMTDLDNLLPLCERHHHAVHELGWIVSIGPCRELTLVLPDGTRQATGPPSRSGP